MPDPKLLSTQEEIDEALGVEDPNSIELGGFTIHRNPIPHYTAIKFEIWKMTKQLPDADPQEAERLRARIERLSAKLGV